MAQIEKEKLTTWLRGLPICWGDQAVSHSLPCIEESEKIWFLFETNLVDCHVLVIPNAVQGHMNPMMQFSKRLTIAIFSSQVLEHTQLGSVEHSFFTQSCAVNTVNYNIHEGQVRIQLEKLPISVSRCLPVLEITDLPSYLQGRGSESDCSSLLTLFAISFWNFREADWIFLNTFNILEEEVVNWLASQRSIKTIGPMIPSFYLDKQLEEDKEFGLSLFKSNLDGCMEWLDSKETGPVVYVSFGSLAAMGEEQMAEVDWGLKRSDCYFL